MKIQPLDLASWDIHSLLYQDALLPLRPPYPGCLYSRTMLLTEDSGSFSRYLQPGPLPCPPDLVFPTSVNGDSTSGHPWLLLISNPTANPSTSSVGSTLLQSHPCSLPPPPPWSSHHHPLPGFVHQPPNGSPGFLSWLPAQSVLCTAARVTFLKCKSNYIPLLLKTIQWLPTHSEWKPTRPTRSATALRLPLWPYHLPPCSLLTQPQLLLPPDCSWDKPRTLPPLGLCPCWTLLLEYFSSN